nr:MAG TPA: hypothetical protein [Inoviridae sp.]
MGYQVGNNCYATKQEADNVYYSLVAPVINTTQTVTTTNRPYPYPNTTIPTVTAKIISPEYKNGKWYLQDTVITANLPQCEPINNLKQGLELGWLLFGVIGAMYVFVLLKRLIR